MDPISIKAISFIANKLFTFAVEKVVSPSLDKNRLRKAIHQATLESYKKATIDHPQTVYAIEDVDYLRRTRVERELIKLIHPSEQPQIEILCEEWGKHFNYSLTSNRVGDSNIVLSSFLRDLNKRLRDIDELRELLHQKDTFNFIVEATDSFRNLQQGVNLLVTQAEEPEPGQSDFPENEQEYNAIIDVCLSLKNRFKTNAALEQLLLLEESLIGEEVSNDLRFRINTNIGGCELEIGKQKNAIDRFKKAFELNPDHQKALANLALAHLLNAELDEAIKVADKSLEMGGEKTPAMSIKLQALAQKRNYEDLDDLIEEEFINKIDYVRALGVIFLRGKRYKEAEKYFRLSLAQDDTSAYTRLYLVESIFAQLIEMDNSRAFENPVKNQEVQDKIDEGIELSNKAFEISKSSDNPIIVPDILATRAALRGFIGDIKGAKKDLLKAQEVDPNNILVLHNLAVLYLHDREFKNANDYLERIPPSYRKDHNLNLAMAEANIGLKKYDDAIRIVEEECGEKITSDNLLCLTIKVKALFGKGAIQNVLDIKNQLISGLEPSADVFETVAFIDNMLGNQQEALKDLLLAYKIADKDEKPRICIRIANHNYYSHDFSEAIKWFEKIKEFVYSQGFLVEQFAISLYQENRLNEAYDVAKKARESGIATNKTIELEAWLAEYRGDLDQAFFLDGLLVGLEPSRIKHLVERARLTLKRDNPSKAQKILESIKVKKIEDSIDFIRIADLFLRLNNCELALELAYIGRIKGINFPEIHLGYVSIMLRVDNTKVDLDPNSIIENTAVLLESDEGEKWMKVIKGNEIDESLREISPESDLGSRLMGKKVGDKVVLREGPLETLSYKVKEIQSIYVRAFQESMDEFGTRFPDHQGLHRLKIVGGDYTKFLTLIARQSEFAEAVYQFYHSGGITLERFANLIGRGQIDVLSGLTSEVNHRIFSSIGNKEIQELDNEIATNTQMITMGVSSLVVLSALDLLQEVHERFEEIFVPQQALDEISSTIDSREIERRQGSKTIFYKEGSFFSEEIGPEKVELGVKKLEKVRNFLTNKCTVISIAPENMDYLQEGTDSISYPGLVSMATVLVAKQTISPLCVDDFRLRHYAMNSHGLVSLWSHPLIKNLHDIKLIDFDRYLDHSIDLILANFYFVPFNCEMLMRAVINNNFQVNPRLEKVFSMLKGPDTIQADAISIASHVIRNIWLSPIIGFQRREILYMVLRCLVHGRIPIFVLSNLIEVLQGEFALVSHLYSQVHQEIINWFRIHSV
ncbi:MAG: hypothetical protein FVQ83_06025 [Chloroflexi bacterium]|nr:hypothetical protein [Chloroflexota bacterium]